MATIKRKDRQAPVKRKSTAFFEWGPSPFGPSEPRLIVVGRDERGQPIYAPVHGHD